MASDRKQKQSNSIPIRFFDGDGADDTEDFPELDDGPGDTGADSPAAADPRVAEVGFGGPDLAELVASRADGQGGQPMVTRLVASIPWDLLGACEPGSAALARRSKPR